MYKDIIAGSQPAPLKISNPKNFRHANVSEQNAMSASKVAGYIAETGISVQPAGEEFYNCDQEKAG